MIIKNLKTTAQDQKYFSEKAKINEAAQAGKLGKEWYYHSPVTGKYELRPKRISKMI